MDRMSVEDAARALGIKEESVRKRVSRGKLRAEKDPDGRLLVWVDGSGTSTGTVRDGSVTDGDALIDTLRSEVEDLRVRLDRSEQAHAEMRRIVAGLVQRVPELEAPEDREDPAGAHAPGPEGSEPHPATGGAQNGSQERRSWWRRWFGG